MKRILSLVVVALLAGSVLAQTKPSAPDISRIVERPDITVERAKKDIAQQRYRFFTYGLMAGSHRGVADILQKDYGIKYEMAAGCIVSSALVERVRAYNECMEKAIRKKFGKSSQELYAEAQKKGQTR
jgi:hypothetical protein